VYRDASTLDEVYTLVQKYKVVTKASRRDVRTLLIFFLGPNLVITTLYSVSHPANPILLFSRYLNIEKIGVKVLSLKNLR
jgi:hypothetical protein